jgi:cytochrome P450
MITVTQYKAAMEVLKHPHMVQALYDEGRAVMGDVLLTLHGETHSRRRSVEFGVFRRGFFREYEQAVFPATLAPVLARYLDEGEADLVELGYRVMMNLTADFAGIDRQQGSVEETESLLSLIKVFSTGATLVHSHLAAEDVNAQVAVAMQVLEERFLAPSIARRQQCLAAGTPLPNDILSKLLEKQDKLALTPDQIRREIAFFLQAGAHSTANATVHAVHEILQWIETKPERRQWLLANPVLIQRCVHESIRLHPASPIALRRAEQDSQLLGQHIRQGELVTVDLQQANTDPELFGVDAKKFNPQRELDRDVWPFGLSFGYGTHACLGRDLDGGVVPKAAAETQELQMGIVPLMVQTLLQHSVQLIPHKPPQVDTSTSRPNFGVFPVQLSRVPVI